MSIIIATMYQDYGFISSDKILSYQDRKVEDNFKKIYQIGNKKLYCGITGVTDYLLELMKQINFLFSLKIIFEKKFLKKKR